MPVYFEPRKRKNRRWLSARPVRFGTVLLSAWLLLTGLVLLSPPEGTVTPTADTAVPAEASAQPFAAGTFGIVMESNSGARSLTDEFMTLLADSLDAQGVHQVMQVDSAIDTTESARRAGLQYRARLVIWMQTYPDHASLTFTLVSPADTVAGSAESMWASMLPREFYLPSGLNTDTTQVALFIKGIQQYHSRHYAPAVATFEHILANGGDGVPAWILQLYLGNALFQQGIHSEAMKAYNIAATGSLYGMFNQGSIYYHRGEMYKAWQMFDVATWYGTDFTAEQATIAHFSRGRAAERMKLYDLAFESYNAAVRFSPHFRAARNEMNELTGLMNAQKDALPTPDTAYTSDISVLYERAGQFIDLRDYESALSLMLKAVRIDPKNPSLYNRLGYLYGHLGRAEEAIEAFDHSLRLKPRQAYAYMGRAYQTAAMGNMTAANVDFAMAIRKNRDYAGTYIAWGLAYQRQGNVQQAGEKFWAWMMGNRTGSSQAVFARNQATITMTEGHIVYLTVTAQAGQSLSLVAAAENPYLLDPTVVVLTPSGSVLAGNDDRIINDDFNAELTGLYLPMDGKYTIAVSHAGGGSEGKATITYSLR